MNIQITKDLSKQASLAKELFDRARADKSVLHLVERSKHHFVRYAMFQEELVGMAIGWKSSFHPECLYFQIVVDPFYYSLKVEEKLLEAIESLPQPPQVLQTIVMGHVLSLKNLYRKHQFQEIRKTYMPALLLDELSIEKHLGLQSSFLFLTLEEVAQNNHQKTQLVRLVRENYRQSHLVNPVAEMSREQWEKLIWSEDVVSDVAGVICCPQEKTVQAYAFLHTSEHSTTYELGWCGSDGLGNHHLLPSLVAKQIQYLQQRGKKVLQGEFDTTDAAALIVLQAFPFQACPTLITYRRPVEDRCREEDS